VAYFTNLSPGRYAFEVAATRAAGAWGSTSPGLLPACAWCRKIRDEDGSWQQFEAYVSAHTDAQFAHGMCPECFARSEREDGR